MLDSEAIWIQNKGTDREGNRFWLDNLVHASGRILAKISLPLCDEYRYNVAFYCTVPKTILADQNECFDFIDIDSARAFALAVLAQFDPISLSQVANTPPVSEKTSEVNIHLLSVDGFSGNA